MKLNAHRWLLSCCLAGCLSAVQGLGEPTTGGPPIGEKKTQLVTVVSDDWDAFRASLRRYERLPGGPWTEVGVPIDVVLGHAGYGWGRGLHGTDAPHGRSGPAKREGDGRSPAGVFELGPMYGYGPSPPPGTSLSYVESTSSLRCVDDPASLHYNRIVSASDEPKDWNSAEHMLRGDDLYETAIVVHHNTASPVPGAGSCIFLHVWDGPDVVVRGCTAMAKPALRTLSNWLERNGAVLVALPRSEYEALAKAWDLPARD